MAMTKAEIETLLRHSFPDAQVTVVPLADDDDHYAAKIRSKAFAGLSRVRQHQMVYAALKGKMGGDLHALALETSTPE